jgi:NAD(P)-dependent dehydrogenase (short-subunit alcohol dehydrogenase family)
VTDYAAIELLLDSIDREFGGIDCLVTAAGIGGGEPLVDYTPESIRSMIDVNVDFPPLARLMTNRFCRSLVLSKLLNSSSGE